MKASKSVYIIVAVLFMSCHTGNKVISSFGKRKYTKGYYVNLPGRKRIPDAPENSANPNNSSSAHPNNITSIYSGIKNTVDYSNNRVLELALPIGIAKAEKVEVKLRSHNYQTNPVDLYDNHPAPQKDSHYDRMAKAGNTLGIISIILLILFFPLGFLLGIVGLVVSIAGLRSEKYHRKAQWGIGLCLVAIIVPLLIIGLFVYGLSHIA